MPGVRYRREGGTREIIEPGAKGTADRNQSESTWVYGRLTGHVYKMTRPTCSFKSFSSDSLGPTPGTRHPTPISIQGGCHVLSILRCTDRTQ